MSNRKGEIRRGQLITTYGVGAVVALQDESFMVAGIDRWPTQTPDLHEPRLERRLGVVGFVRPPAGSLGVDIPVVRFPTMVSCRVCKRLARHDQFTSIYSNECRDCGETLIPSRFVVACEAGHIDDFPYWEWIHRPGTPRDGATHTLSLNTEGATASLRDIIVSCSCGASRSLEGAFGKHAMRGIIRCRAKRPWLTSGDEQCDHLPRTLQRGASNVWFANVESAISIPPWSEGAYKVLNKHWPVLQFVPDESLRSTLLGMGIAANSGYDVDDLVLAVQERRRSRESAEEQTEDRLRRQEFEALVRGKKEVSSDQDFVCEEAPLPTTRGPWFSKVMLVKRLREIRALKSFSRVDPRAVETAAPLAETRLPWLPAIEVAGEGVFFLLNEAFLTRWEREAAIDERARELDARYRAQCERFGVSPGKTISARFVLVHTLAHLLLNQWSLDSGYPAASLRERLYSFDDGAGFLIYTASSDSAGSLGGIVAQAERGRLETSLEEMLEQAHWCSADPVCIETTASGTDALNAAACHSCLLVPEVSCEERNLFLDRALAVGTPDNSDMAFLGESPRAERV